MASVEPPELFSRELPSGAIKVTLEHNAGVINIQAKSWLSAETTVQQSASLSMGLQEGALGEIEGQNRPERIAKKGAPRGRLLFLNLPRRQALES
eukprot:308133-Pyramimonas_sp.AAC.1